VSWVSCEILLDFGVEWLNENGILAAYATVKLPTGTSLLWSGQYENILWRGRRGRSRSKGREPAESGGRSVSLETSVSKVNNLFRRDS
jgi:hypothetical protein